ncbi:nuclear GTPase SLIP-GC-like [Gymnodraco acuticeps]|uniref:Nuclear GTPase SLIP-GC-like n=1 Tax=Gymnodraco acuticeps TaxID=8218 RepID=A0A6P8WFG3_GYMAC|nr:nuclear GTPase SLIP-GC-like [Gymnodraco acuticeps]XP_034086208.1 nuclear GTPase SLIP-GC-like [Gymnodraco acuticeps]
MDNVDRNKLFVSKFTPTFQDHEVDKESLYCLEDRDIADLIPKEEQSTRDPETSDSSVEVCPSKTNDKGKRKLDLPGESSQSPARKRPRKDIQGSNKEKRILSDVKNIMRCVLGKLPNKDDKLIKFLKERERNNLKDLETEKSELVGVFGKTGAGKSSLINAVIGVKGLLPSGSISACTSVMIKVEANMKNPKYEADIEFITKEEWKEELWTLINFAGDNEDQENDEDDDQDSVETLSLLYGKEWKNKTPENLMDKKYYSEIPEFLSSGRKTLTSDTAKKLSSALDKYTQSESSEEDAKRYWPLVKCVTVRVPNNPLLQHVTLVDLPGNGDRNKSRDTMWKKVIRSCSTVWIVTDINRAASEKEPWEILKESCSLMGNGGQCRQIHFICTKSDMGRSRNHSAAGVRAQILNENDRAKTKVRAEFSKQKCVKKQFSEECFKVFTVSSTEFLKKKRLDPNETEIPKLQNVLQELNDSHSETFNYVSRARGILSLMQGASSSKGDDIKKNVRTGLEKKLICELQEVREAMKATLTAFKKCLSRGVNKSKSSCEKLLKSVLYAEDNGSAFHRTLKCVVEKGGIHITNKGKSININMKLASCLTDCIDEEFKKTFPNEGNSGPFNGVINAFSLGTEKLKNKKYKNAKLQLTFLMAEEEKIKTELNEIIRERKKTIYRSLEKTIKEKMKPCYDGAEKIKGKGSMNNMRQTIEEHVRRSKDVMFTHAKNAMMEQLEDLMSEVLKELKSTMQESIVLSLKTHAVSIPDVSVELEKVNKHCNDLT